MTVLGERDRGAAGAVDALPLRTPEDVVRVRQAVRERSVALGFSLVDQTKLVTAASELARNTLDHGRGGDCRIETLEEPGRSGLRLRFRDDGPGIADIERALTDGFTTGGGLGVGLGGARRLVHDFRIESTPGSGTVVEITRWNGGPR
jgi:serine/threonine-protein kinase RsbT